MFRKERDLTERSRTLLKNKETKALKTDILRQYSTITEDDINTLLPNKVNLTSIKLVDRTILYAVDDIILFFDVKGRNDLYPSIVTLWKLPHIMKTMVTHGPVSRNLIRGADLMVPGVIKREVTLQGLADKEKCAVRIYGNPLPFAVGNSCFDYEHIVYAKRGKALDIVHSYGDLLVPAHTVVLPPGYLKDEILPTDENIQQQIQKEEEEDEEEGEEEEEEGDEHRRQENGGEEGAENAAGQESDVKDENNSGNDDNNSVDDNKNHEEPVADDNLDLLIADAAVDSKEPEATITTVITKEMYTEAVLHSFVLFLKHVIKDPLLPILVSTMWPMFQRVFSFLQHSGSLSLDSTNICTLTFALKQSIFSRPVTLLAYCQQHQILNFDEKTPGVYMILSIQRSHLWFREHKYEHDADKLRVAASSVTEDLSGLIIHDSTDGTGSSSNQTMSSLTSDMPKIGDKKVNLTGPASQTPAVAATLASGMANKNGKSKNQHMDIVELHKLPRRVQELFQGYYQTRSDIQQQQEVANAGSEPLKNTCYFGDCILRVSEVRTMLQRYVRDRQFVRQEQVALTKPVNINSNGKGAAQGQGVRTVVAVPETDPLFELYESVGNVSFVPRHQEQKQPSMKNESSSNTDSSFVDHNSDANHEEDNDHAPFPSNHNDEKEEPIADVVVEVSEEEGGITVTEQQEEEEVVQKQGEFDDDEEDRELTEEEQKALIAVIQQQGLSSDDVNDTAQHSMLFANIDKQYRGQAQHQMKIAKGGLQPISDNDDYDEPRAKNINAKGNTIFSKPVSLPPPAPKKVVTKQSKKPTTTAKQVDFQQQQHQDNHNGKNKATAATGNSSSNNNNNDENMLRVVTVTWEDAMKQLLSKLTAYHAIIPPSATSIDHVMVRSGHVPTVKVITEKRAGNKTVTIIRQLDALLLSHSSAGMTMDLDQVTKLAQKKFACSCAVSAVPGIEKQKEIVLQGPFAMDVPSFLFETQGIPPQYVEVVPSKHLSNKKKR